MRTRSVASVLGHPPHHVFTDHLGDRNLDERIGATSPIGFFTYAYVVKDNKGKTGVIELLSCSDEAEREPLPGRRDEWHVIGPHVSEPEAGEVSSQNNAAFVTSRLEPETAHRHSSLRSSVLV